MGENEPTNAKYPKQKPTTETLTTRTIIYLIILKIIGSTILNGGINFGLAIALYRNEKTIRVWLFPNTLAGDAAVTVFIQGILTWIIDTMMTSADVRKGVYGISPRVPPQWIKKNAFFQWMYKSNLDILEPNIGARETFRRLFHSFLRSLPYCVFVFVLAWPIGCGILAGASSGDYIDSYWKAAFFKLGFGGLMSPWQTAVTSLIAITRKGWVELEEPGVSTKLNIEA
eukprot:TRINITY_DN1895_c0_g1_i1.p1 TRINITY_DN1895_c0_g1~~TRINITY_DN1895_c0_g1_i1.p1  ORF type:complete len:228 (+),score=63.49 TRINITY_DN1895_c0_g1_i1:141-824(+)